MHKATGLNRHRSGWTAEYEISVGASGRRAHGALHDGKTVVRERFDVKMADDGTFQVDIGTGSGVKVKFRHA